MEGIIAAIHGDVVEIEFSGGLPNINDSLVVKNTDGSDVILEVHDHISSTVVKAIALGFTQGLKRGMTVIHSSSSLKIPASKNCLGRVFNVFGEPTDGKPLEPKIIFNKILEEFLYISLYRCYMESLRSENWYRLRSMDGASETLKRQLSNLNSIQMYTRQEEITEEMLEILGSGMFFKR